MRGIVSVALTPILSHPGEEASGRCFEIVSKWARWSSIVREVERDVVCAKLTPANTTG